MLPILRTIFVGGVILAIFLPAPDDPAGPIGAAQREAGIPIDIGEASSTELPVVPPEETPPVIRMPRRNTGSGEWRGGTSPAPAAR
jgi:hypothetical protein